MALLLVAGAAVLALLPHAASAGTASSCGPIGPSSPVCYKASDGAPTTYDQNKYRWIDSADFSAYHVKPTYSWTEISTGGTPVPGTTAGKLGRQEYNSGTCIPFDTGGAGSFAFKFYGNTYDCAWVNSNGFIQLDNVGSVAPGVACVAGPPKQCPFPEACATPTACGLPQTDGTKYPRAMIAGYWVKDMEANPTDPACQKVSPALTDMGVYTRLIGVAPNRRWIVEWNGALVHSGDAPASTCQDPPSPGTPTCANPPHAQCYWATFEIELVEATDPVATIPRYDFVEVMLKDVRTPDQKPDNAAPIPNYASLGINSPFLGGSVYGLNYRFGPYCQYGPPGNCCNTYSLDTNVCFNQRAVLYYPNRLPKGGPVQLINEDSTGTPTVMLAIDENCAAPTYCPTPTAIVDGDVVYCNVQSLPAATVGTLTPGLGPNTAPGSCVRAFTPAPNYCTTYALGSPVQIPMKITDNVGLAPLNTPTPPFAANGQVDVTCINDAPTLNPTPSTTPSGPAHILVTYSNFATGIAAGPATAVDEVTQAIDFPMVSSPPAGAFSSGPTLTRSGGLTSGNTAKLSFVGNIVGTYSNICFRAKDNGGTALGGIDTSVNEVCFSITVMDPGACQDDPTCGGDCGGLSADFSITGNPLESGEPISFTYLPAGAGTVHSWSWDFGDGFTSTDTNTQHTYASPGDYLVRLVVVDTGGCAAFKDVRLSMLPPGTFSGNSQDPNAPPTGGNGGTSGPGGGLARPVVDAGEDQVVREGVQVKLLAMSRSGAQDGLVYSWRQAAGPVIDLKNPSTSSPDFVAPNLLKADTPLQLLFAVKGFDGQADSIEDFVRVTVIGKDQHAPIADAGRDQTILRGDTVTLDAAASLDPDGDAVTFAWSNIGGATVAGLPASGKTVTLTTPSDTTAAYIDVKLTVSDASASATDTVRIWLQAPSIVPPGFHAAQQRDGSVLFSANAPADSYFWDFGDGEQQQSLQATIQHTYATPGTYKVSLRLGADAAPVTQDVTTAEPPKATASGDNVPSGSSLMLGVTAAVIGAVVVAGLLFVVLRPRKR
ncbi:MAG: PKD domain-containing protein [bacterium]